jgi:hypothetical protein
MAVPHRKQRSPRPVTGIAFFFTSYEVELAKTIGLYILVCTIILLQTQEFHIVSE